MSSYLRNFDLTGQQYSLFFNQATKYKNCSGGIFTIILYFFISAHLIQSIVDIIKLKKYSSIYNYYYLNMIDNQFKSQNFSNQESLKFDIKLNQIIPAPKFSKFDNFYRLVANVGDSGMYVLPKCTDNNKSYCFNFNEIGKNLINMISEIKLLPCQQMRNVLNPQEISECKGNNTKFDKANKMSIVNLVVISNLYSYNPSVNETFDYVKSYEVARLVNGLKINIMAELELVVVHLFRTDFLIGFDKLIHFINSYSFNHISEKKETDGFEFSYTFGTRSLNNNFYSVHEYKIKYTGLLEAISSIGGLIKVSNIFILAFRKLITNKLCLNSMFEELHNTSNINLTASANTFSHSKERLKNIQINNVNSVSLPLVNKDIEKKINTIENRRIIDIISCCSCKCKKKTINFDIVKKIYSFQTFFSKMKEMYLLKHLLFKKNTPILLIILRFLTINF